MVHVVVMKDPILPPKHKPKERKGTSIRLPDELKAQLDKVAKARGYNRSEAIVRLLEFALKQLEEKK